MNKLKILILVLIVSLGQAAFNFINLRVDVEIIKTETKSINFQEMDKKIETNMMDGIPSRRVTKIVYKYKKTKNLKKIEKSITIMKKLKNYIGSINGKIKSQPAKIAKVLVGKLLIGRKVSKSDEFLK